MRIAQYDSKAEITVVQKLNQGAGKKSVEIDAGDSRRQIKNYIYTEQFFSFLIFWYFFIKKKVQAHICYLSKIPNSLKILKDAENSKPLCSGKGDEEQTRKILFTFFGILKISFYIRLQ